MAQPRRYAIHPSPGITKNEGGRVYPAVPGFLFAELRAKQPPRHGPSVWHRQQCPAERWGLCPGGDGLGAGAGAVGVDGGYAY